MDKPIEIQFKLFFFLSGFVWYQFCWIYNRVKNVFTIQQETSLIDLSSIQAEFFSDFKITSSLFDMKLIESHFFFNWPFQKFKSTFTRFV